MSSAKLFLGKIFRDHGHLIKVLNGMFRYPEETNDCCLFLSYAETERTTEFDVSTEYKKEIDKSVAITKIEKDITDQKTILMNVETSVWKAQA